MGILMSAYVAETDAQAQAEAKEGVWYFLKNCLKGHLRREGRQLTFGPGIPYIPPEEFRNFLKFSDPTSPLLGDAESWDDLQQSASIVVGSAETVYRRIMDILEHSKVGNLLIQFHLGNMQDALARKSMRLFATEVAPRLKADSAQLFAREFPQAARDAGDGEMSVRTVDVRGRKVAIAEAGEGPPLVYLHGFADVHGVAGDLMPFHQRLAQHAKVIAPAHPGCNGSDELSSSSIDDVVFHYLELFDAAGLPRFDLVGHCVGGWIAAELAVRHPERVARLTLIGACGLFVPGEPIGDVFMHAQPERGTDLSSLRALLFAEPDGALAKRWFPDGRGDLDEEVRRYQMLRFGSFVGFKPPYFYHRELRERLYRASMPSLVIWGGQDRMVPPAHGAAYDDGLPDATGFEVIDGAGHAVHLEQADRVADRIAEFHEQHPDEYRQRIRANGASMSAAKED